MGGIAGLLPTAAPPNLMIISMCSSLTDACQAGSWRLRGGGVSPAEPGPSPAPSGPWQVRQRVEKIFHACLRLPAERRAAALDRRCEGDPGLRADVEAVLEASRFADGFIEGIVRHAADDLRSPQRDDRRPSPDQGPDGPPDPEGPRDQGALLTLGPSGHGSAPSEPRS